MGYRPLGYITLGDTWGGFRGHLGTLGDTWGHLGTLGVGLGDTWRHLGWDLGWDMGWVWGTNSMGYRPLG